MLHWFSIIEYRVKNVCDRRQRPWNNGDNEPHGQTVFHTESRIKVHKTKLEIKRFVRNCFLWLRRYVTIFLLFYSIPWNYVSIAIKVSVNFKTLSIASENSFSLSVFWKCQLITMRQRCFFVCLSRLSRDICHVRLSTCRDRIVVAKQWCVSSQLSRVTRCFTSETVEYRVAVFVISGRATRRALWAPTISTETALFFQ